jgi:hypothetical protein
VAEARFFASREPGDPIKLEIKRIDKRNRADSSRRYDHPAQVGRVAHVVETDSAFAADDWNLDRLHSQYCAACRNRGTELTEQQDC